MKFFTPLEVANILQLTPRTIRNLIKRKVIKAIKIGKQWRIPSIELIRFTEGN